MKNLVLIALPVLLLFSSCKKIDALKDEQLEFNVSVVGAFDGIELRGVGSIYYTQDTVPSIRVITSQKVYDVLEFDVASNTLVIDIKDGYTIENGDQVKIYISQALVNRFVISGAGNINADLNSVAVSNSEFKISGSGSLFATNIIENSTVDAKISGSGDLSLEGTANNQDILISGSGNVSNYNLYTTSTMARITGSGNIYCRASTTLNVTISGQGNVYYKGTPTVNTNISGSGNVINAN